jgi:feruloyl esterase
LTDAQIATVNLVHAEMRLDFTLANDVDSYPGWPIGHEDSPGGWQGWIVGARADPSSSLGFVLPDQVLRFMVARDPTLDTLHFSPNEYVAELRMFSMLFDATNADLSAFAARGGKLILWHGLADYGVSARSTTRYYERVVETMGAAAVDGFLRFYLSPGVDHLGGGPGPGSTDFLSALIAWVETGTAPEDLISHELQQGTTEPILSRPLCRYPRYPRYNDSGEADDAASFHCAD